jgi:hypothetical protein
VTLVGDAHLAADTKLLTAAEVISHHNALLDGFGGGAHLVSATPANKVTF